MEKEKAEADDKKKKLAEFFSGLLYCSFVTCLVLGFIGFPGAKNKEGALLARSVCRVSIYIFLAATKMTDPGTLFFSPFNNRPVNFILGSFSLVGTYYGDTYFALPVAVWCLYKADLPSYF
jgi:hypothetical protein